LDFHTTVPAYAALQLLFGSTVTDECPVESVHIAQGESALAFTYIINLTTTAWLFSLLAQACAGPRRIVLAGLRECAGTRWYVAACRVLWRPLHNAELLLSICGLCAAKRVCTRTHIHMGECDASTSAAIK